MGAGKLPTVTGFYWARCRPDFIARHGGEAFDGEDVVEYTGEPDRSGVVSIAGCELLFRVDDFEWLEGPLRRGAPEPRWHEIATEGLPPRTEDGFHWTWDGNGIVLNQWIGGTDMDNPEWAEDSLQKSDSITHWWPIVKPAPPTKG